MMTLSKQLGLSSWEDLPDFFIQAGIKRWVWNY
jgi:hypothetical protein